MVIAMTYEKIFSDVQKNFKKAKISDFTREFAFQFNITGEGEGIFYAAYKNGVLSIEPYDYQDRDVIFTADGKTLTAIASGKLEPIDAINDGKLFVDGNHDLAKEIMLLINHEKKSAVKSESKKPNAKNTAAKTTASAKKTAEKNSTVKTSEKAEEAKPAPVNADTKAAAKEEKTAVKPKAKPEAKTAEKTAAKTQKTAGKASKK